MRRIVKRVHLKLFYQVRAKRALSFLLVTRIWEKSGRKLSQQSVRAGYSPYACSETVIELERNAHSQFGTRTVSQSAVRAKRALSFLLVTRIWEKSGRKVSQQSVRAGYSPYACSETVIELERNAHSQFGTRTVSQSAGRSATVDRRQAGSGYEIDCFLTRQKERKSH